jgi:hypothetical protein
LTASIFEKIILQRTNGLGVLNGDSPKAKNKLPKSFCKISNREFSHSLARATLGGMILRNFW